MIIENNYVLMQSTKQAFFIVVPKIDSTRKKLMKGFYRKVILNSSQTKINFKIKFQHLFYVLNLYRNFKVFLLNHYYAFIL